ncbi:hypothetical protein BDR03DRAFT_952346 [Suillus americanus]|nr:hypothetical protein BDR03DRAFT_952346 [Suillus americanus]
MEDLHWMRAAVTCHVAMVRIWNTARREMSFVERVVFRLLPAVNVLIRTTAFSSSRMTGSVMSE